jgi:hypothetical protein
VSAFWIERGAVILAPLPGRAAFFGAVPVVFTRWRGFGHRLWIFAALRAAQRRDSDPKAFLNKRHSGQPFPPASQSNEHRATDLEAAAGLTEQREFTRSREAAKERTGTRFNSTGLRT